MDDVAHHSLMIWELFQFQGWEDMLADHWPTAEVLLQEFYANIHHRRYKSFWTWVRQRPIVVTPNRISNIIGAPRVAHLVFPWVPDIEPTRSQLVECSVDRRPHKMGLEGQGGFSPGDLTHKAKLIYRVIISRIFSVWSFGPIIWDMAFVYTPC